MSRAMGEAFDRLKRAGFDMAYVWRSDVTNGSVSSYRVTGQYLGGYKHLTVNSEPHASYGETFVDLGKVAMGEDSYGQTDTVVRSNFTAIQRDYPQVPWVCISYLNTESLGIFLADLVEVDDPEGDDLGLVDMFVGLAEQYPIYDESAMSELEFEEIGQSWEDWLRDEIHRAYDHMQPTTGGLQLIWDDLGEQDVSDLWWRCVSAEVFGNYPEHRGVEVVWGSIDVLTEAFRPFLVTAYWAKRVGNTLPYNWVDLVHAHRKGWDY